MPAFSLIELLVVIAVVALLVSILLPGMGAAREQARRVVCASNQRQYVMAIGMYADANKQTTPLSIFRLDFAPSVVVAEIDPVYKEYRTPSSSFGVTYWDLRVLMGEYLPGLGVMTCPSVTKTLITDEANTRGKQGSDGPATYCSYYYFGGRGEVRKGNKLVIRDRFPDFGLPTGVPQRVDAIEFPSLMPLVQDATSFNRAVELPFLFVHGRGAVGVWPTNPSGMRRQSGRSSDVAGANIASYDGHVVFTPLRGLEVVGLEQRVTESVVLSRLPVKSRPSWYAPADVVIPGISGR